MKIIRLLTLCLISLSLLLFTACSTEGELSEPSGVTVDYEILTLKWGEVAGAKTYTVRIETEGQAPMETEISKNYYSLETLSPGLYDISVRANGNKVVDSRFSESISFEREVECGLEFNMIAGGYEVSGKGQATGKVEIPATYRKKDVIAIGENAFFNASDISEIKLPESIKSIGAFAFAGCSYLEKINIPKGLNYLGESAFSGCRSVGGELSLPDSLTEIPKGAFAYCSSLESVRFGEKLSYIGDNAFTDCSHIKALAFPETLREIGGFAFAACADVPEINFREGLLEIGEFAFSKALSLTSVSLPDSLKYIGKGAFYLNSALESVTLGSGVEELGDSAFLDTAIYKNSPTNEIYVGNWFIGLLDASAPTINIIEGTVGIANSALYANQNLTAVELPNSVKYIGVHAFAASNIVSIVTGSGVKRIADEAFLYCEKLIDVALGSYDFTEQEIKDSSLLSIGNYAFMNCPQLQRITIPSSVIDIGAYAFRNTDIFKSSMTGAVYADNWIVDFNDTITEELVVDKGTVGIARYAFYNCQQLKSIKIDSSVRIISKGAFYNCTALERVEFPDELETIEDYAFYSCTSLKLTRLPPMLKKIGRSAFYLCGRADNYIGDTDSDLLEIPAGVTYIGDFAFYGCGYRSGEAISGETATAGIDIIVIGDSVEYIGKCAFRGFASLRSVTIAGTAMIGDKAFYECSSLEQVVVGDKLVGIGNKAFYKCSKLKTATFPSTLTSVGEYAFYKCESLETMDLGKTVEKIGAFAFYGNTLLKNISLPTSVISIGGQAFRDCKSLSYLSLGKNISYIGAHAFYSCPSLTVYIDSEIESSLWDKDWNSSFVPAVWGCEITSEGYLYSVKGSDKTVSNMFSDTILSQPVKEGYVFLGFSKTPDASSAKYPLEYLAGITSGERLYSVFDVSD